ncbi:MAG: PilZ domain-containing protein [Planctomycetes bacterium]|nr:PilZ domain-containing protein [Planctomycetota bacterium]
MTSELRASHANSGSLPVAPHERRQHPRFYFWRRAILEQGGRQFAGFTRDLSKAGIRLLSPVQLFPCDETHVILESGQTFRVSIRRCLRLADDCYECGAEFFASQPSWP